MLTTTCAAKTACDSYHNIRSLYTAMVDYMHDNQRVDQKKKNYGGLREGF